MPVGAIVKSLVFAVAGQPVLALVAGDRRCATAALGTSLGLEGRVERASADLLRAATGFALGGVPPVAQQTPLPTAIDASLGRFPTIWAAAGHPYGVLPTTLDELARLTGGTVSEALGVAAGQASAGRLRDSSASCPKMVLVATTPGASRSGRPAPRAHRCAAVDAGRGRVLKLGATIGRTSRVFATILGEASRRIGGAVGKASGPAAGWP